jgi:MFS family permease
LPGPRGGDLVATLTWTEGVHPGFRRSMVDALPLFAAMGLLMAGHGLTSTLLGIRAGIEGFRPTATGLVLSGYYAGFLVGSLAAAPTIRRVGHVRVFAGLASLASAAVLVHVVRADPLPWLVLRVVSGVCLSGLYVVTETWLNGVATNSTRGGMLAGYMVVVTGGMAAGQLLFSVADAGGFAAFVLASVLVSLAVVPVALANVHAPDVPDPHPLSLRDLMRAAPLAGVGAALSGFLGAAVVSGGVIFAAEAGLRQGATSALIFAALAGALLLQFPLGRWSDRTDRRLVIVAAGATGTVAAVAAAFAGPDRLVPLVMLMAVAGGMAFPLYSLANAHLNDYLADGTRVAAGARMVLMNGMGAIAGPLVVAATIEVSGPVAMFAVLASAYSVVAVYALYRITRRAPAAEAERASYVPVPVGSSMTIATMADGAGDELYEMVDGTVTAGDRTLAYQEQGTGEPVVLVHDLAGPPDAWHSALSPLAADGVRAIAPQMRSEAAGVEEHVEDLLELLRGLVLPSVTLVGTGTGGELVARFAADHPDRVNAVVLAASAADVPDLGAQPVLVLDHLPGRDAPEGLADQVADFLRRRSVPAADLP